MSVKIVGAQSLRLEFLLLISVAAGLSFACGSSEPDPGDGMNSGGLTASGGTVSTGGSSGGGESTTGGETATGGAMSATGGADMGVGGGLGTGGEPGTGGQAGTGGGGGEVLFDLSEQPDETPAGTPYDPYPNGVVVTKVMHFGVSCWKIAAAGGTLYFENGETAGKSGFDSALDVVGNDWIGNDADKGFNTSPKGNGKHEYRGWPNFGNGDFDHPQRSSGTSTRWVDEGGNDLAFDEDGVLKGQYLRMRSANNTYELEYHFFASHVAIKIIKAMDTYAFLYEGPIGGEQEGTDKDKWVLKDGSNGKLCTNTVCASPFIYFVDSDPQDTQVWYFGAKDTSVGHGGDSYVQANNMVVVSYGRYGSYPNDLRRFEGTDAVSVFGFHAKGAGHAAISSFIEDRLADPFTAATTDGVIP